MFEGTRLSRGALLAALAVPTALFAGGGLVVFTNGTIADANQVNANFALLEAAIPSHHTQPGSPTLMAQGDSVVVTHPSLAGREGQFRASVLEVEAGDQTAFGATGADQTFVVPTGVTSLRVKLWGAGGSGGGANGGNYVGNGGGGGFTDATIAVTPGETLTLVVGRGGLTSAVDTTNPVYGGGFRGGFPWTGGGGGRTAIRRGSVELATAGGGGGGGFAGVNGGAGHTIGSGAGAGAGGSGYVDGPGVTGTTRAGSGTDPAGTTDPDYVIGVGVGGGGVTDGGDGYAVLSFGIGGTYALRSIGLGDGAEFEVRRISATETEFTKRHGGPTANVIATVELAD